MGRQCQPRTAVKKRTTQTNGTHSINVADTMRNDSLEMHLSRHVDLGERAPGVQRIRSSLLWQHELLVRRAAPDNSGRRATRRRARHRPTSSTSKCRAGLFQVGEVWGPATEQHLSLLPLNLATAGGRNRVSASPATAALREAADGAPFRLRVEQVVPHFVSPSAPPDRVLPFHSIHSGYLIATLGKELGFQIPVCRCTSGREVGTRRFLNAFLDS